MLKVQINNLMSRMEMIPFNRPYVPEKSKRYALEVLESNYLQGNGAFTEKASKLISDLVGGGAVFLTPSCTDALEMASTLGDFGPGDEVILPSFTFTSAATAVTQCGATPVFVDIDPLSKCIDVNQVAEAVTDKTVAVSWVNYAGMAPDIGALQEIARDRELLLIEDNAHGLGGSYSGRPLGSFGDFATQSFHETKNVQCGEGGALVVNNPKYLERANIIRDKGTNRSQYLKRVVKKYEWVDKGSSYLLAETLAAIVLGQLEDFDEIQNNRLETWRAYSHSVEAFADIEGVRAMRESASNVAHMFYLEFEEPAAANDFSEKLSTHGIKTGFHYQSLGISVAGQRYGRSVKTAKHSEKTSNSLLRLPLWFGISENEISQVTEIAIKSLLEK